MANRTGGAAYNPHHRTRGGNTASGGVGSTSGNHVVRPRRNRNNRNGNPSHGQQHASHTGGNQGGGNPLLAGYGGVMTPEQALKFAKILGGLQYNGAIGSQKTLIAQTPGYFEDYRNRLANSATQTAALSQPLLTQANQVAANTGQTLGLTGPAAADDQLAAASRAQQASAEAQALQGIADANQNYYTQTAANSVGAQATAQQQQRQQLAALRGQRGAATTDNLLKLRDADRNFGLEVQTLLGNQAADALKAQNDANATAAAGRKSANDFLAKNGVSQSTWRHMTPDERVAWKRKWNKTQQTPSDRINQAKLDFFRQHGYFPPTGPGKGPGAGSGKDRFGNTVTQRRHANSDFDKSLTFGRALAKHSPDLSWHDMYERLIFKYPSGDSTILRAAAHLASGTHMNASLINALRKRGVNIKKIKNPALQLPAQTPTGPSTTGGRPDTAGNPGVSG